MMSRILLVLFAIFTFVSFTFGSPVPVNDNDTEPELDKRLTRVGRGTWFHVGKGNCGKWNKDSDLIVAMSKQLYDKNGGVNCDQYVKITNTANGKTAYGLLRDSCESCRPEDIDMSPSLFQKLGTLNTGVLTVSWNFKPKGWTP